MRPLKPGDLADQVLHGAHGSVLGAEGGRQRGAVGLQVRVRLGLVGGGHLHEGGAQVHQGAAHPGRHHGLGIVVEDEGIEVPRGAGRRGAGLGLPRGVQPGFEALGRQGRARRRGRKVFMGGARAWMGVERTPQDARMPDARVGFAPNGGETGAERYAT